MKTRNRIRCKKYSEDFRPFEDSKFNLIKIPYSKWLALIKLFELSISANTTSLQTSIRYKTTLITFDIILFAILVKLARKDTILRGEIEADESYFGGKRNGKSYSWS